jgi:hypothetical protein
MSWATAKSAGAKMKSAPGCQTCRSGIILEASFLVSPAMRPSMGGNPMLDRPTSKSGIAAALALAGDIDVEILRGHFFQLDLYSWSAEASPPGIIGGVLHFGQDQIELDREHACQMADRARAALDNCVAGTIIHRPGRCREGH